MRTLAGVLALAIYLPIFADAGVENPMRAKVNYMLNCQGCHGPEGTGTHDGAVPTMNSFVGRFLEVPDGREFLVRVPGSANAALDNTALAEVLNWILANMSAAQIPPGFVPYTADEVEQLRSQPLRDVASQRAILLQRMAR